MGEDGLDLGPVPGLELDDRSSCKCREHGDSQLGSPVLSAGVLHETGWIVWLGVAVLGLLDEVIGRRVGWCCRLAVGTHASGASCPQDTAPAANADRQATMTPAWVPIGRPSAGFLIYLLSKDRINVPTTEYHHEFILTEYGLDPSMLSYLGSFLRGPERGNMFSATN